MIINVISEVRETISSKLNQFEYHFNRMFVELFRNYSMETCLIHLKADNRVHFTNIHSAKMMLVKLLFPALVSENLLVLNLYTRFPLLINVSRVSKFYSDCGR